MATPTLEELLKIFGIARNIKLQMAFEEETVVFSFKVSKKDCAEKGVNLQTTASEFVDAVTKNLGKLFHFEQMVKSFSDPAVRGATASDMAAFLDVEIRNCASSSLQDIMRRRMFSTIQDKMRELGEWRIFVDKQRFDRRAEELRKSKAESEKKAYEEEQKRKKERETNWNYQKAREEFTDQFEEMFRQERDKASSSNNPFEEMLRRAQEEMRRQQEGAFRYGGSQRFRWGRGYEDPDQQTLKGKKWHEVLGVPAGSTKATIKAAWRKLAKQHHPDRAGGDAAKMAEINAAKDAGLSGASS